MKKVLLLALSLASAIVSFGQAADLEAVSAFMQKNDLANAKKMIDQIFQKTPKDSRAYLLKGAIYQTMADDEATKNQVPDGHAIAFDAYKTYISLDKKYSVELMRPNLFNLVVANYNKAINAYNDGKYTDAITGFNSLKNVMDLEGGKFFAGEKSLDTIAAQSKMFTGYAYYNDKKYTEAQTIFEGIAENPIVKDKDIYLRMSTIYQQLGDNPKWKAVLDKARNAYPGDKDILYDEINYYLNTNNQAELVVRLEEATAKDPKNPELYFNLGATLESMIKADPSSKEAATMMDRASKAYEKAIDLDPNNGDYAYNLAVLHWNQAVPLAAEVNKVLKEPKKYEEARKVLVAAYLKAGPLFEKAMTVYEKGGVKATSSTNYRNVLNTLQTIYIETKNPAKDAITKKLSQL